MISYFTSFFTTTTIPVEVVNNPSGPEGAITTLLPELAKTIFSQFDIPTLGKFSLVSKKWNELSSSDDVWNKFENEYEVKAPDLKIQIKTSLLPVYQAIKTIIEVRNHDFYCKLAKTLFEKVQFVKVLPNQHPGEDHEEREFQILLKEETQINFDCNAISNIHVPKNVHLGVSEAGFFFKEHIKLNCKKDGFTPYDEIFGGTGELSFTYGKNYKRPKNDQVQMIWTKTTFLDTASKF